MNRPDFFPRSHSSLRTVLASVLSLLILTGCNSSSGGESDPTSDDDVSSNDDNNDNNSGGDETATELAAPAVSTSYDDWIIRFSWPAITGATAYRFYEDPDGLSGFSQIGPDLSAPEFNYNIGLSERNGARYIVAACNDDQCIDSEQITLDGLDSGITPIVVSGDSLPGIGLAAFSDTIGRSFIMDVNDQGIVVFRGFFDEADDSGTTIVRQGIFKYEPEGALTTIKLDGSLLPGSNARFQEFYEPYVANSGQVLFGGMLAPSVEDDIDGLNNEVLVRNTSGTTALLAREGDPSRGGTLFPTLDAGAVYFTENFPANRVFNNLSIDGSGGITFQVGSQTSAFQSSDDSIYGAELSSFWTIDGDGTKTQSLRHDQPLLPNNLAPRIFSSETYSQNSSGQLAFGLGLANADGSLLPESTNSGIYVRDPDGTFTEVVREMGGSARDFIYRLESAIIKIAENGEVFYLASRDVAGTSTLGLYTNSVDGEAFTRVARKGTPFLLNDGTVQEISDFLGSTSSFDIRNDTVAFLINAGNVDQSDALIIWQDGTATRRFQEGEPVVGVTDSALIDLDLTTTLPAPRIKLNDNNWIGFLAKLEAQPDQSALLVSSPNGYSRLLVREDQRLAIDGTDYGTVREVLDFSIDNSNRLVASLRFADGRTGLFSYRLCSNNEPC